MHRKNKKIWSALLCMLLAGTMLFETICQESGRGIFTYAAAESEQQEEGKGTGSEPSLSEVTGAETVSEPEKTDTTGQEPEKEASSDGEASPGNDTGDHGATGGTEAKAEEKKQTLTGDNEAQRKQQKEQGEDISPYIRAELTGRNGFEQTQSLLVETAGKERWKELKKSLNEKLKETNTRVKSSILPLELTILEEAGEEQKPEDQIKVRTYLEEKTWQSLQDSEKEGNLRLCHLKDEGKETEDWEVLDYELHEKTEDSEAYVEFTTGSFSPFLFVTTETKEELKAENHPESEADAKAEKESGDQKAKAQSADRPVKKAARAGGKVTIDQFELSFISGAKQQNGKYVWTPEYYNSNNQFAYNMDYTVSGNMAMGEKALRFELPLHILKDRDGNWADKFDCPYMSVSEVAEGEEPDFVYEIDEANNKVVIYNYKDLTGGQGGFIEFGYTTTKSTLDYKDMEASEGVTATIYATGEDSQTQSETRNAAEVYIDTGISVSSSNLQIPTRYTSWQNEWGVKPADADQYEYLVWAIQTYINENTAPYNMTLNTGFADLGGGVVGYRFAGESEYSQNTTIENQRGSGWRYDYVLTRCKTEEINRVLEQQESYTVVNRTKITVVSVDGKDAPVSVTTSGKFTYEKAKYVKPGRNVRTGKDGIFGNNNKVYSENSISDYSLREFVAGEKESIEGLRYLVSVEVWPFEWTMSDGATGSYEDIMAGELGKEKVAYSSTDDTLYLNGTDNPLEDADYDIAKVTWKQQMQTATFNDTDKKFNTSNVTGYEEADALTFWVRTGKKDTENAWKKATVYNLKSSGYQETDGTVCADTQGDVITFRAGVKGVRITCENAYYYTGITMQPSVTLRRTSHVLNLIGNQSQIELRNRSDTAITKNGRTLYAGEDYGSDYIRKIIPKSRMSKIVSQTKNDKRKQQFAITWRLEAEETYQDDTGTYHVPQQSGTFYDLIPQGGIVNRDAVRVFASGAELTEGSYDVELTDNYKGSGRTLLKVTIPQKSDQQYQVYYQTNHSYNAIRDYGKTMLNSAAYETGNEEIADGYADTGGTLTEKELMKDLTDGRDGDRFIYAEARYTADILMTGNTGLLKQTKSVQDGEYSSRAVVKQGEAYSYQVRLANNRTIMSKDILLFDSLENFYKDLDQTEETKKSDWKGTLTGVDVSALEKQGIEPVVYLSKVDRLNINNHHDLSEQINGENVWIEYDRFVAQYGLAAAKAVAVDATKKTDQTDFVLPQGSSIAFTIYMQSPEQVDTALTDPVAYNNIFVEKTTITGESEGDTGIREFYHQDHTEMHYRVAGNIPLKKVSTEDELTPAAGNTYLLRGTSDYGTEYREYRVTGEDGRCQYKNIERGTYELLESESSQDWLLDREVYKVVVGANGEVTVTGLQKDEKGRWILKDRPRIHTDVRFEKLDSITKNGLNGVEFLLTGTSDYGTDISMRAVSEGKNGIAELGTVEFPDLEMGTYQLAETKTKSGYICSKTNWSVRVDERGIATIYESDGQEAEKDKLGTWKLMNEPYHKVTFVKTSTYGENNILAGAEFSLDGISDYGSNVSKTAVSDTDGLVVFDGLEPGSYLLKETKAPADHELNTTIYPVKVEKDGTFTIDGLLKRNIYNTELYDFKNLKSKGTVKVTKVWKDNKFDHERERIPDMTISTQKPSKSPLGYTITYDANGGYYTDKSVTTNDVVYSKTGTKVDGTYQVPRDEDGSQFLGWFTEKVGGDQVELTDTNDPQTAITEDVTVYAHYKYPLKYAVAIWGIGVDDMSDGTKGGLTFGPALGANYIETYKSHTPTGATKDGNAHRCIHDDDWATIIEWNQKDPYVYEQCIGAGAAGCTHKVVLKNNDTTSILDDNLDTTYATGDGASTLHNEIADPADRQWGGRYDINWGNSKVRTTLNSKLINTFPAELQAAIGERVVKYDSSKYGSSEANLKTTNDKLWLFSPNEMANVVSAGDLIGANDEEFEHPLEGTVYKKAETINTPLTRRYPDKETDKRKAYSIGDGKGVRKNYWTRSIWFDSNYMTMYILYIQGGGSLNYGPTYNADSAWYGEAAFPGLSPGFTLKRNGTQTTTGNTITYDARGGTFTDGSETNQLTYADDGTLSGGTYEQPTGENGATFAGWYTQPVGGTEYQLDANKNPQTAQTGDITVYARYTGTKYAVSVYGIGVDEMSDGNMGGLTFGPALGADYTQTAKNHTPDGDTAGGNPHRCINNDSWRTIIQWNQKDAAVYEQCITEGCTHDVVLNANTTTTILNSEFKATELGDGPSTLYFELRQGASYENMRYHPNGGATGIGDGGWGTSRIRAMMNGADALTDTGSDNYATDDSSKDGNKSASIYTEENCLLATFPAELRAAIGSRAVKYDSVDNKVQSLKVSNDKLWLLSPNEVADDTPTDWSAHPREGSVYEKLRGTGNATQGNTARRPYRVTLASITGKAVGDTYYAYLRSIENEVRYSPLALFLHDNGMVNHIAPCKPRGVSACFTLKK